MVDNVIIMAGGAGKRLWPASMGRRPKQFMCVDGDASLFRQALHRAFELGISGSVYIVTHEDHLESAVAECRLLEYDRRIRTVVMAEPIARNTAPALALAGVGMMLDGRAKETSLVMAADHIITPMDAFAASVRVASDQARNGYIVPYGIVPRSPATGYGYIEAGNPVDSGYEVLSFREKPDGGTAQKYVESGRHFWNAGLFTYRNDVFADELQRCAPDVAAVFANPDKSWFHQRNDSEVVIHEPAHPLRQRYDACPSISVDYAVMERSEMIRMVKADFEWNDVGSWDVIAEIGGSPSVAVYEEASSGNFVYADRPVALCGVEDLIVVVANGRVMVCKKGMSQLVKDVAEKDLNPPF